MRERSALSSGFWLLVWFVLVAGCASSGSIQQETEGVTIPPVIWEEKPAATQPVMRLSKTVTQAAKEPTVLTSTPTEVRSAVLTPTLPPSITSGTASAAKTAGEKWILVRISEQRVYAYVGQHLIYRFSVSTGRNKNTATGSFSIRDKIASAKNVQWNYQMPLWMGVYWVGKGLENGFHAPPLLKDGSELWADQIGTPVTDGCIVLQWADMQRLYDWADVGTRVEIVE